MRSRRRVAFVAVVATVFVGSSTAVLAQTSGGGAPLGGYKVDSRAQAINVLHDSPDSPSPTHPDFDGSVPAAQSTIDTGPIGHGLAAIFRYSSAGGMTVNFTSCWPRGLPSRCQRWTV